MTIPRRAPRTAASSLESRLAAVEDQLAIRDLTARYNFAIDNRDMAGGAGAGPRPTPALRPGSMW